MKTKILIGLLVGMVLLSGCLEDEGLRYEHDICQKNLHYGIQELNQCYKDKFELKKELGTTTTTTTIPKVCNCLMNSTWDSCNCTYDIKCELIRSPCVKGVCNFKYICIEPIETTTTSTTCPEVKLIIKITCNSETCDSVWNYSEEDWIVVEERE